VFITLESIEGAGKTTQLKLLTEYLEGQGRSVLTTREPGGSRLGLDLRRILLAMESRDLTSEAELFLYLADRAQHVSQVVKPALADGAVVISDRFADSTVVYQGYGRGLDPHLLHQLNDVAVAGCWPALTILLDLPPEVGLKRAMVRNLEEDKHEAEGRFEAEALDFHARVREGYLTWASLHTERFVIIDATAGQEEVFAQIRRIVDERLARSASS
jgi:dTMP kinase